MLLTASGATYLSLFGLRHEEGVTRTRDENVFLKGTSLPARHVGPVIIRIGYNPGSTSTLSVLDVTPNFRFGDRSAVQVRCSLLAASLVSILPDHVLHDHCFFSDSPVCQNSNDLKCADCSIVAWSGNLKPAVPRHFGFLEPCAHLSRQGRP